MAEAKFEFLEFTPEEIRATRERMSKTVDSHALAHAFMAQRTPRPAQWAQSFEGRFGFDPRRTLTELEGFDAGDGYDVADEPQVHALRRVPLTYWTAGDACLMLTYRQGIGFGLWLALDMLAADPMLEASHYPGDLLIAAAGLVGESGQPSAPSGETARGMLAGYTGKAEIDIWRRFEEKADRLGLSDTARRSERERIADSLRSEEERDQFWEIASNLNYLAEARATLTPPIVLRQAAAEMIYAVYRPRHGLEIVPRRDLDNPAIRAHLEKEETFYFRRGTRFEIVDAGDGAVRLRHFSQSAIENWLGIAFDSVDAAIAYARTEFGVAREAWSD